MAVVVETPDEFSFILRPDELAHRSIAVGVVIDFDAADTPYGIEIISFAYACGVAAVESLNTGTFNSHELTYDGQADAFYVTKIGHTHSYRQRSFDGSVVLDSSGQMIAVRADLSSMQSEVR